MDNPFTQEKVKLLEMQANYLRYLASNYPIPSSAQGSPVSSSYSSLSPLRSSREPNPHDSLPVKKVSKPFEQLLEEQLQQNPSLSSSINTSLSQNHSSVINSKFLKRGGGHLCTLTRSFSSSRLKSLRKASEALKDHQSRIDLEKINSIRNELKSKNEELKREEKELIKKKKCEIEEIKKLQVEKNRELKSSPYKDELENLRKVIKRMSEEEKIKEIKHQEEVRRLNVEILRLREKVGQLEKKKKVEIGWRSGGSRVGKSIGERKENSVQGKIQRFVERSRQQTERKKENVMINQFGHFLINDDY